MGTMTHEDLAEYLRAKKPQVLKTIARVLNEKLTFLSERQLIELAGETALLAERGIPGAVLEAGCALGGSAIVLAAAKEPERPLYLYDMFGMIPIPGLFDGWRAWKFTILNRMGLRKGHGGDKYYGYEKDLLGKVMESFRSHGFAPEQVHITAIKGRHEKTLAAAPPSRIAFAHIDSDWYKSVKVGIKAVVPNLVVGGRIVFDDYYSFPGCRRAVDEYFAGTRREMFEFVGAPVRRALHVVKLPES